MGRRSEIHELERRISEYWNKIDKLESSAETIRQEQAIIESDVLKPNRTYDMSSADEWRGNFSQRAKEYQAEIDSKVSSGLRATERLLSNIQKAIERLHELIRECEERISELEAEIEAESCAERM